MNARNTSNSGTFTKGSIVVAENLVIVPDENVVDSKAYLPPEECPIQWPSFPFPAAATKAASTTAATTPWSSRPLSDPYLQHRYKMIMKGDFDIFLRIIVTEEEATSLVLDVTIQDDPKPCGRVTCSIPSSPSGDSSDKVVQKASVFGEFAFGSVDGCESQHKMGRSQDGVSFRVIHWFLRQHLSLLLETTSIPVDALFDLLSRHYSSNGASWNSLYDVVSLRVRHAFFEKGRKNMTILADASPKQVPSDAVTQAIIQVGSVLEASKEHTFEAAHVYMEAHRHFVHQNCRDEAGLMMGRAGRVEQKAGNFAKAEILYLGALRMELEHTAETADSFDPLRHSFLLDCLLSNYGRWTASASISSADETLPSKTLDEDPSIVEIETLALLLQSLLYLGGYQSEMLLPNIDGVAEMLVRSHVQSSKMARKTLFKAFLLKSSVGTYPEDATKFRRSMMKAGVSGSRRLSKGIAVTSVVTPEKENQEEKKEEPRSVGSSGKKKKRQSRRSAVAADEDEDQEFESAPAHTSNWMWAPCTYCGQKVEKHLECKCGQVRFCNKGCQLRHWNEGHKDACSRGKKKKCSYCGEPVEKGLKCTCYTVIYCSCSCQTAHWKDGHSKGCPKFGKKY